jgi:hypothetical protein
MHVSHPFVVYVVAPVGPHEIVHRQPHQQIPELCRVQDVGVVHDNGAGIHQ